VTCLMDWLDDCECDGVSVVLGVEVSELEDDWLGEDVTERLCVKVELCRLACRSETGCATASSLGVLLSDGVLGNREAWCLRLCRGLRQTRALTLRGALRGRSALALRRTRWSL